MCGIVGIVHLDGRSAQAATDGAFLRAACARLVHRGPDDERIVYAGAVGLGFRRLSIVDLPHGAQPMGDASETILAMTNGEIYNHRALRDALGGRDQFRTESDCEVVVHAYARWGIDYVTQLNGMFATAIVDRRQQQQLHLVRDRLGIKPLYLYHDDEVLLFASEMKALLAHPAVARQVDLRSVVCSPHAMWLPRWDRPTPAVFGSITEVPPGHRVQVDLRTGQVQTHRYWDPRLASSSIVLRSADEAVEAYRETLADAVRLRLMADVEIGLFLSGGIDSVSVAALARRAGAPPFHTFSVLSQSTLTAGDAEHSFEAARALGLPNHQVRYDWRSLSMTPADWKRILWSCEMPRADAEALFKYYLHAFARAERPALKVMLLGQGSDEFNGGYCRQWVAAGQEETWANFLAAVDEQVIASQVLALGLPHDGLQMGDPPRLLIARERLADWADTTPFASPWHAYREMYRQSVCAYNLWHEDRTAAAHSIEDRVPFLDHRLVELTYAVPEAHYGELFWDKAILRRAMEGIVPEPLRGRPKVPFFHGEDLRYTRRMMAGLLRADDGALVEEALAALPDELDADGIRAVLGGLEDDPEYKDVDALLHLVNAGLLQSMARAEQPLAAHDNPLPCVEVVASTWDGVERAVGLSMVERHAELALDSIVRFASGVVLVRWSGGDRESLDPDSHYLAVDAELTYVIESTLAPWVAFLERVDGRRTVGGILEEAGVSKKEIWKHLEEALEHEVLVVVERP
ncbi:MAG: asparagine synthase (glutamine-hydrolyzing) [Myxococcota bacterium]